MPRLILSTSNIMGHGPPLIRRPSSAAERSNTELTASLRTNFTAAQHAADHRAALPINGISHNTNHTHLLTNGNSHIHSHTHIPPYSAWTTRKDDDVWIPSLEQDAGKLAEERSQYEITVKLFYLPHARPSTRCAQTREAVQFVLNELGVSSIDLLIVSFPGISFDADDEEESDDEDGQGNEQDVAVSSNNTGATLTHTLSATPTIFTPDDLDTMLATWQCLEQLHDEGIIRCLGVAEFGSERLKRFLASARIRPTVNQISVRDCCVVPRSLILLARQEKIELLTHNDCTNILPRGTLRDLLGPGPGGAGVLASTSSGAVDGHKDGKGLEGDVEPQWVVKYTAVVRNRGVIENKGYFAVANLADGQV